MPICTLPACTGHYACSLRAKGVQVSPTATPSRVRNRTQPVRPVRQPSWERGVAGQHRPGGGFMPILKPGTTDPLPIHDAQSMRHTINDGVRRLRNDPHVFTKAS